MPDETTTNQGPIDLPQLSVEIETVLALARARVVELREALEKGREALAQREEMLARLAKENEASRQELYGGKPSKEFVAAFEQEASQVREEVGETRHAISVLQDFTKKFEEQLLALVDLDKKMTAALLQYKFLREKQ